MNTSSPSAQQAEDYRTSMQQAAAGFIERHQAEHLDNDHLYDRTVSYLVTACGVPVFMADRIAHLAMSEHLPKGICWIGWDMASGPDRCVPPQRYQSQFIDQLGKQQVALPAC